MSCSAVNSPSPILSHHDYYARLNAYSNGSDNARWLTQIIASWQAGQGVLPKYLGLGDQGFTAMLGCYFPGYRPTVTAPSDKIPDFSRMLEKQDLENYLARYAALPKPERDWIIGVIVAACLGSDHLWQDLGLFNRSELSALLNHNFPAMAAKNLKDMKWKKFIYKQLCEEEGLYVCRAPSCEVCQDYPNCFGAEE